MENIIWMNSSDVIKIHNDIITTSGGLPGINSHNSVDAILLRVQNHAHYVGVQDFSELAALLMFSIVKGHAFNDGNKRTALITVDVFTQVNGYELTAQSHEIAIKLVEIASNEIPLEQFTGWLRQRIR